MSGWRWVSRHPVVSVIVALVLVASAAGAVLLPGSDPAEEPGNEAWLSWPVRGDLAGNPDLVAKAAALVAGLPGAPQPHVLWIGRQRQDDQAFAFVAVTTGKVYHETAVTAVLYTLRIVPSTGVVTNSFTKKTFRSSDLGIEVPELLNDVPGPDSYLTANPVLTAAGVDKVEFHTAGAVMAATIRADGIAHQTAPGPKAASSECQPPVTLVTALNGDVQALQDANPAVAMHRPVKDRQEAIRLLVSLMAGLNCRNRREGNIDYSLVNYRYLTAGPAWPDGRGPYTVLGIGLTDKPDVDEPERQVSLAVVFPTGASAIIGEPRERDTDTADYARLAVKVNLGVTDAVLTTRSGRRSPITVPALPVRFDGPVVLFGPHTDPVAVVHLDIDGNASSAQMVR
jgi:hypothetical protein